MTSTPTNTTGGSASGAVSQVDQVIGVQIPTWNQLFQEDSQCECQECESITGAPHFLVTILQFLEGCGKNDLDQSPYDYLIQRVPYLPYLPLTCDNTNDVLPYIRVVLDILEFYTANNNLVNMPAYDSGTTSWMTSFEQTAQKAYQAVAVAYYPFNLPYHQPLDNIRAYLTNVNSSWKEVIAVFDTKDPNYALRLLKEQLQLSDEGYTLLTQYQIDGGPVLQLYSLYNYSSTVNFQKAIYGVPAFLAATGLEYTELIHLLKAAYINPGSVTAQFINNLLINGSSNAQAIFSTLKTIATTPMSPALQATITTLLQSSVNSGLDPTGFKNYVTADFTNLQNTIIIIPDPNDACDYENATLATIQTASDPTIQPLIADASFLKMYFFIRVLRLTGLKIHQLDVLMTPLSGKANDVILNKIGRAIPLMKKLGLTTGQVVVFYGTMNSAGTSSTYGKLFLSSALSSVNADFQPDAFGNYFTLPASAQYNTVLLVALQLTSADLTSLVQYFGTADATSYNRSLDGISVLYSYALLARSLQMQMADMLSLIKVFGSSSVLRKWNTTSNAFDDSNLQVTWAFVEFVQMINDSPFMLNEFLYVLGMPSSFIPSVQITTAVTQQSVLALQTGFAAADQQNPPDPAADRNMVLAKLLQYYTKDIVGQLAGMLDGTIVYSVVLPGKPVLTLPTPLTVPVTYDPTTGTLQVTGVLSTSDWTAIQAKGVELSSALQSIYNQPGGFLKQNFGSFITTDALVSAVLFPALLPSLTLAQGRYIAFYQLYQPVLVQQLKTNLVIKTIASLLSLDTQLTGLIAQPLIGNLVTTLITITGQVSATTDSYPNLDAYTNALSLIQKGGDFVMNFRLTVPELTYFQQHSADFSNIDFTNFTLAQWQQFNEYYILRKYNQSGSYTFIDLFQAAATPGAVIAAIVSLLIQLTGWRTDDVNGIIAANGNTIADFRNGNVLYAMTKMMEVVNKTNLRASQLLAWVQSRTDFNSLGAVSASVASAVLQPYVGQAQSDRESSITGPVLQNQRTALGLFILNLPQIQQAGLTDFDDLSDYFYIEVPMQAVMPTSRIRQAISTVQTFVTRALMGLETKIDATTKEQVGVAPSAITADAWQPFSIFRVWQVTMEFLANPYPYLSYQYLTNKSVPALNLEQTLQKSDITPLAVENAYLTYLQDLCETANLEIVSMYIEDDPVGGTNPIVHVIGKSRSVPYNYYYCSKDVNDIWSFWSQIPVGIKENDADTNGPAGSHVIFVKFKNRYYIFLPEYVSRQLPPPNNGTLTSQFGNTPPDPTALNYWEVQMAVSEYYQGTWSEKTYLKPDSDLSVFQEVKGDISRYFFTVPDANTGNPTLQLSMNSLVREEPFTWLIFTFTSLNSAVIVNATGNNLTLRALEHLPGLSGTITTPPKANYCIYYQNIVLQNNMIFPLPSGEAGPRILSDDEKMYINFSPQYSVDPATIYTQPFFFHDNDRCYFVTSVPAQTTIPSTGIVLPSGPLRLQPQLQLPTVILHPEESLYQPIVQIQ